MRARVGSEDDRKAPERTCAATRKVLPADELIRFVRAPDGTVVPDLKRALPGRGVWVTASREAVATAVKKKAFTRGFKEVSAADPGLADQVGDLLSKAALAMLGFVNKAGLVVAGFSKVEAAFAKEHVVGLVAASDASEDGVRKIGQVSRRFGRSADLPVVRLFAGEQLDLALGRSNVVHAALLAGPVSAAFLARCQAYARYLGDYDGPGRTQRVGPSDEGSGDRPAETDRHDGQQ